MYMKQASWNVMINQNLAFYLAVFWSCVYYVRRMEYGSVYEAVEQLANVNGII